MGCRSQQQEHCAKRRRLCHFASTLARALARAALRGLSLRLKPAGPDPCCAEAAVERSEERDVLAEEFVEFGHGLVDRRIRVSG